MDLIKEKNKVQSSSPQTPSTNLADRLRNDITNILNLWEKWVREEVRAARDLRPTDLKNSLPKFLENLALAIESEGKGSQLEVKFAREHGKERSAFSQYTLEQIIAEYRLLRRAIFEVIGKDVSPEERDNIIDAIEIGISEAASEFATQQLLFREQFVSMLAHDLRNPLSAAKTNAQLILRTPDKTDSVKNLAARIVNTVNRADMLIKDLLDSNLVQMGRKLPLEIKACELSALIKMVVEEVSHIYGERFVLEGDLPINGFWDPLILQRSIGNLLTNAIKYGDPDGLVKITITQNDSQVLIAVHNEGKAIPQAEQSGLFDNFYRASKVQSDRKEGWGIGLFLVKGAMTAHGGTVEVKSLENEGTTFTLTLPKDCRRYQQGYNAQYVSAEGKLLH